ncbi:S1/P1 Nuclease [Phenylobacterium sp.]|uniref:S1/P1 Nuclease n=1 Tax=Phenylobacterium sp. TaxID=1871053 RepID=UPI0030F3C98C
MKRLALNLVAVLLVATPAPALAWSNHGHRMIGQEAARALPDTLPSFVRGPAGIAAIGELSREPDRSKGSGKIHDSNRDPAHFVDYEEDGRILGGPRLDALPPTRALYEAALQAAGQDSWKAGYLPYAIVDQYQQLVTDFGYWRMAMAAEPREKDATRKAWLQADRLRREQQALMTIGYLGHYVGDGAQPLHVSAHYNGWGAYPNPQGYSAARVHGPFEDVFAPRYVTTEMIRSGMPGATSCNCAIEARVAAYLLVSGQQVVPFYELEKAGGFAPADPRGVEFARTRMAAGAAELRDLIALAWIDSAKTKIGWPPASVAEVISGKVDPYPSLYGKLTD